MVAASFSIRSIDSLPDDVLALLAASQDEGLDLVSRLIDDWNEGSNRFDQPGEILLEVRDGARLVGVGGLNRDPYLEDPGVGRIRHLYVLPQARGHGGGSLLVLTLVERARAHFRRLRLRAGSPGVGTFYLALGFVETDEADATHELRM